MFNEFKSCCRNCIADCKFVCEIYMTVSSAYKDTLQFFIDEVISLISFFSCLLSCVLSFWIFDYLISILLRAINQRLTTV